MRVTAGGTPPNKNQVPDLLIDYTWKSKYIFSIEVH
jgi:hypothetical protein